MSRTHALVGRAPADIKPRCILRKANRQTPQPRTTTKQSIDSYPTPDSMRSRIRSDAVRS